jgi:hypothetical protein
MPQLRAEVMSTADFYSDRDWHSTGMYSDVLRPAGVQEELVMPLPGPPGVARRLALSPGTVRNHLENAYIRLGITSPMAAVAQAFPDTNWV